jgi:hypothetical protein
MLILILDLVNPGSGKKVGSGIIIPDPPYGCLHCVLQDVFISAFDGLFKEQRSAGENWLAVEPHRVPSPRPGENVNSSLYLPSSEVPEEKQEPV